MPSKTFPNPGRYAGSNKWQIKIYNDESQREDPHINVLFKERPRKTWRINLLTLEVMDATPPKRELPRDFLDYIKANIDEIRKAWNGIHPKNQIRFDAQAPDEQEGEEDSER